MKALRVLLPLAVAGLLLVVVTQRVARRSDLEAYRAEREALRREMVERSTVARGTSGASGIEEARVVLRWWTEAVESLRGRHPAAAGADARGDAHAGTVTREGAANSAAFQKYADERVAALRAGYAPSLTATDQGVRVDVLGVAAAEHPETHERGLRIDFAVWGVIRRVDREPAPEGQRAPSRVVVPLAFRQLGFRFVDASGKTYGEMTGNGEPYLVLKDPERFSPELPPGVAFGTWWVEPFPREAARVEWTVGLQIQGMSAAALTPTFRWEVPVADDWKLRPGEVFRAETKIAPPEAAPDRR